MLSKSPLLSRFGKAAAAFGRDRRGNAFMLIGFAMFPLLAAIGLGVDIARAHMTRVKLQQAVDAAALAGRRVMTGDDINTAKPEVASYLAFNFPAGIYGSRSLAYQTTKPDIGAVRVTAQAVLPTAIMGVFGYRTIDITAASTAVQTFKNVDIMLVLDTTGSMNTLAGSVTRIEALKDAVKALYDQLKPAQSLLKQKGLRMRFGILPYAATANVGKLLYKRNTNYIRTSNVPYYHWKVMRYWWGGGYWDFGLQTYSLAGFANNGPLGNVNGNNDQANARWGGCVEERKTDSSITATDTRDAAPATAIDLDIDRIPDGTEDTKFSPYIFDPRLTGDSTGINSYCPAEATELTEMDETTMAGLLNKLVAKGSTYHDIGMIWGTRMISNGGIWGGNNPNTFNQIGVQRYIVYMTDGEISAPTESYSGYGIEDYDRRTGATSDADNDGRHTKRFLMVCNAAKAKGISIWTIAFATGRVASLDKCASSVDQSSIAANSSDLIARFATIGKSIGSLRISN